MACWSAPDGPVPRRYASQGMRLRLPQSRHGLAPGASTSELPIPQRRSYNSFLALVNTYVGTVVTHRRPACPGTTTPAVMVWKLCKTRHLPVISAAPAGSFGRDERLGRARPPQPAPNGVTTVEASIPGPGAAPSETARPSGFSPGLAGRRRLAHDDGAENESEDPAEANPAIASHTHRVSDSASPHGGVADAMARNPGTL
jgi:hypothetical protein